MPEKTPSWERAIRIGATVVGICTIILAAVTAWVTTKAQAADALDKAKANEAILIKLEELPWVTTLKNSIQSKASKVITDAEIARIWAEIRENTQNLSEAQDVMNALELSDERFNAKIELEVERLRNEIQRQASQQNQLLQTILDEVREP